MCEATRAKNAVYNHKHHDKQLVFIFLMPRGSATGLFTDPNISFGRPVLANKGIPVDVIAERYKAGESIDDLMLDYECEQKEIEEAIRFELYYRKEAA